MFRFFKNLVDPFTGCDQTDTPARRLLPFPVEQARQSGGFLGTDEAEAAK